MSNNISGFEKCANCGACENVCPVDAIKMKGDGTYYSIVVEEEKCIKCGKCVSVCPVNNKQKVQNLIAGYAGFVDSDEVLLSSSSGGIFYAIAKKIMEKGGVVYGAAFDENYHSVRFYSTDEKTLRCLQKSKYVESAVGKIFRRIKNDLRDGKYVLFCGTPCQSAGLCRYLEKKYEKLVVCDFSCGGLPSHKLFDEYLVSLEIKYKSHVEFVDFRPKNYGWENYSIYIKMRNKKVYTRLARLDPYYKAFLSGLSKRDYCYCCDFADNHYSDLILADFWLYKKFSFGSNNNRGLSLVLSNSEKGERIMGELSSEIELKKIPIEKASYNIKSGHMSEELISLHQQFLCIYESKGFKVAINELVPPSIKKDWKNWVKQFIKRGKYEGSKKIRD